MPTYRCVTANLEKGHKPGVQAWLESTLQTGPAMVFGQELHKPALIDGLANEHGYHALATAARTALVDRLMGHGPW